jgi:organic radical activating enzyme
MVMEAAESNRTDKVVLTGGDPLFYENLGFTIGLMKILSDRGMKIALYTGETHSNVKMFGIKGYEFVKCLPYEESLAQKQEKDDTKMVLASRNQQIWDKHGNLLTIGGVLRFDIGTPEK